MFRLAAFAAILAVVACQEVIVNNGAHELSIDEGRSVTVTFRLTAPIFCSNGQDDCDVRILLTNSHPNEIELDTCVVRWFADEWQEVRRVTIKATENFINDRERLFHIITEVIDSPLSEFYHNVNPADLSLKTKGQNSGFCKGTGDPHYTTFDGLYFHIFRGGQTRFFESNPEVRQFEMQARMYQAHGGGSLRPAVHCGVAALEDNQLVIVDICNGNNRPTPTPKFTGPRRLHPKIIISGNTYRIEFVSGTIITVHVRFWGTIGRYYMNVYLTVPGIDFNSGGRGICGNFNGNRQDDTPTGWFYQPLKELLPSQKVDTANGDRDLWLYEHPNPLPPIRQLPKNAEECQFVPEETIKPLIELVDAEDITDILKEIQEEGDDTSRKYEFIEDGEDNFIVPPNEDLETMTLEDAQAFCNASISNSKIAGVCRDVLENTGRFVLATFLEDCAEDLAATGDQRFVLDTIIALEEQCAELALKDQDTWEVDEDGNPIEPNTEVRENMCPEDCNGNGQCVDGKCKCNPGFIGGTCAGNLNVGPSITGIGNAFCNVRQRSTCRMVEIAGENLIPSDNLVCKFGSNAPVPANWLGAAVECEPPFLTGVTGAQEVTLTVSVSNDGTTFSNELTYTYFDGHCLACSGGSCGPNPESCTVDDVCFLSGDAKVTDNGANVCLVCDPESSTTDFTFTYDNRLACGPRFDVVGGYAHQITGPTSANTELLTITAQNPNTVDDENNVITYTIEDSKVGEVLPFELQVTGKNEVTVVLTEDVDVELKSYLAIITAVDQAGNQAQTQFSLNLDHTEFFINSTITINVAEDTPIGTKVFSLVDLVSEEDRNLDVSFDFFTPSNIPFAVNPNNGDVTVAGLLDFETTPTYFDQIKGDVDQRSQVVFITIHIDDVNEKPTAVELEGNTVDELAPSNTVVGTLSTVDPDHEDTFTYTVTANDNFAVVRDTIVTKKPLEVTNGLTVEVIARDSEGLTVTAVFPITVVDVNQKPDSVSIVGVDGTTLSIPEDQPAGTKVGDITATDPDGETTFICLLVESAGGVFDTSNNNLILAKQLDFETTPELKIVIRCADDGEPSLASDPVEFTINVLPANDIPKLTIALNDNVDSIPEDTTTGTVVGTVTGVDQDAGAGPFGMRVSTNFETFQIGSVSCEVDTSDLSQVCTAPLVLNGALDFETSETATFVVAAIEKVGGQDVETLTTFTVNVGDAAEFNLIGLFADSTPGEVVGTLNVPAGVTGATLTEGQNLFNLVAVERRRDVGEFNLVVADGASFTLGESVTFAGSLTTDDGTEEFSETISVERRPFTILLLDQNCATPATTVGFREGTATSVGCLVVKGTTTPQDSIVYTVDQGFTVSSRMLTSPSTLFSESQTSVDVAVSTTVEGEQVTATLTVEIRESSVAPHFSQSSFSINILEDETVQSVLNLGLILLNPDNVPDDEFSVAIEGDSLGLFEVTGNSLLLARSPESVNASLGAYPIELVVSVTNDELVVPANSRAAVAVNIVNPCVENGCSNCIVVNRAAMCCSETPNTPACQVAFPDLGANRGVSNSSAGIGTIGIIGMVVGALVLIALIALAVVLRRQKQDPIFNDLEATYWDAGHNSNPTFVSPNAVDGFEPGLSNPMYGWYHPDMSRQECTDYLAQQGEGAFAIRDSKATPGWHMLGVKTRNAVVHEKIKMDDDGTYAVLPSSGSISSQPKFKSIPELVSHYASRSELGYHLALDNPTYDNHQMHQQRDGTFKRAALIENDPSAPMVPIKMREHAAVTNVAYADVGEDLYTNTEQAKAAISEA